MTARQLQAGNVRLAISHSGSTVEAVAAVIEASSTGAATIAITTSCVPR